MTTEKVRYEDVGLRERVRIPPQPMWFPSTTTLAPQPGFKREALRLIGSISPGDVLGHVSAFDGNRCGQFEELKSSEIRAYILDPSKIPNSKRLLAIKGVDGGIHAINLPEFADLMLLPKTAQLVLKWLVSTVDSKELMEVVSLLLRESAIELPTKREILDHEVGFSQVSVNSFGNYFKAVNLDRDKIKNVVIRVEMRRTTSDPLDGRTTTISIEAKGKIMNINQKRICCGDKMSLLIWNCRGVASTGFSTAMGILVDMHLPEAFLLIETRVSEQVLRKAMCKYGFTSMAHRLPVGMAGDLVMLVKGNRDVMTVTRNDSVWECNIVTRC